MIAMFDRGNGFTKVMHIPEAKPMYNIPMLSPADLVTDKIDYDLAGSVKSPIIWEFYLASIELVAGEKIAIYNFTGEK